MKNYKVYILILFFTISCGSCQSKDKVESVVFNTIVELDSISQPTQLIEEETPLLTADDIALEKSLLYDKYTLDDVYPYKDTTRCFQWNKIKERLALLENLQQESTRWAILQNYKNRNGEAPLIRTYKRDAYKRIADTLGIERYQSAPLYALNDTTIPVRYGKDGGLVRYLGEEGSFIKIAPVHFGGEWLVPKKYIKQIPDTLNLFKKAIVVDRSNQNIATIEHTDKAKWTIRSMNPATTGRYAPPYAQRTPLGIFVIQEKKQKMVFLKDGSQEKGGFAPYASRFSNGGYIHGVPTNLPQTSLIEYSPSLGTTPRSHMCVRNATSHAKFVYDWAPIYESVVFVIE